MDKITHNKRILTGEFGRICGFTGIITIPRYTNDNIH